MKKTTFLFLIIPLFSFISSAVLAQGNSSGQGTNAQMQQKLYSPVPSGIAVQNQNQVNTQNKGEDFQIQVQIQEQESEGDLQGDKGKEFSSRSENAREHMSIVAAKIEEILSTRMTNSGIGEQVRQIAQEQKEAQQQIQTYLEKVEARNGVLKSIIGPDFAALKNMQKVMEQNQLRIQELTQLKNQLNNQGDIEKIQEAIQAMVDQNTALQNRINLEEKSGSLFGWFFKFFVK